MAGARYLGTFALAVLVTFGLFWVMQALIGVEGNPLDPAARTVIEFVRLKRETEVEKKKRELPDKRPPEEQPPPPDLNLAKNLRPDAGGLGGVIPAFASGPELGGPNVGSMGAADSDVVPLVRVNPEYPIRAAQRGIEGWVEVEFTIGTAGNVKEAAVIGYYPSSVFNKAALRAIRRWKYNPRVEGGEAVERSGVIVRLTFELEK